MRGRAAAEAGAGLHVDVRTRRGGFVVEAAFDADAGETVALLGPNGAGKSTLVGAIAGLVELEGGRIELDGRVLDDPAAGIHVAPQKRSVGAMFQDLLLFPHLSALDNVAFPLRARGVRRAAATERSEAELQRLGMGARAGAKPVELSGGEAQRVALARALVVRPRVLLLDEPLAALDVQARPRIRALLKAGLASFGGVRVLVTHDPVEAMTLADRLVLMDRGRVTQTGTPREIRERPQTSYAAELVGLNLFVGRLEPLGDGAGRLVTPEGEVVVGWPPEARGVLEGVTAVLRPADVALHVVAPGGVSARNVLEGPISAVSLDGERARIRVATSPPVVAEVTLGSLTRLGLSEGVRVWASFKALEVQTLLP